MKAIMMVSFPPGNKYVVFHARSIFSGKVTEMSFPLETYAKIRLGAVAYNAGALVQKAFGFLTPTQREFLLTGMSPEEQDKMYKEPTE